MLDGSAKALWAESDGCDQWAPRAMHAKIHPRPGGSLPVSDDGDTSMTTMRLPQQGQARV
jgi:hypothetical protein